MAVALAIPPAAAQVADSAPAIDRQEQARRRPAMYLSVFNNGYGPDDLPADPARFEDIVRRISTEGNFNAVMCKYSPSRLEVCERYGVKMIVDLLGNVARAHDNRLGRLVESDPGLPGKGNYNRSLFTQNTSIACGVRAVMWFIGSRQMDPKTVQFTQAGRDAARVNAWLKPLWFEIPKLSLPEAIYATPVTRDFNNRPVGEDGMTTFAPGLERCAFPPDFWMQPAGGEFVMGVSRYGGTAEDAVYVANLNAYAEQDVKLRTAKPVKAMIFVRETGTYEELKAADGLIGFTPEPAGAAVLRFHGW